VSGGKNVTDDGVNKAGGAPDADPPEANNPEATVEEPSPQTRGASILETLTAERDALAAEKADLHDRLLRTQAEFQNFRKRSDRERLEFAEYASTEAVRALLPILDDFERALKTDSVDKEFRKGMELIYQRLYTSLQKLGLEPITSAGQPFDPHIHHAVDMVETEDAADHTVLEEFQRGYNFKGRLLRPAMVKVAVAPARK
jgi:molecular chaperone GrpE